MANDCLVTKLKGVVNNPNLPKLGELIIRFNATATPTNWGIMRSFQPTATEGITISVDGDGCFTNLGNTITAESISERSTYPLTTITLPAGSSESLLYFYPGSSYNIHVQSKYALKALGGIGLVTSAPIESLDDIKYLNEELFVLWNPIAGMTGDISTLLRYPNIQYVELNKNNLTGDVSILAGLTNVKDLVLWGNTELTGRLEDLGPLTQATNINLSGEGMKVTGSIDAFVQSQIAHGRTSTEGAPVEVDWAVNFCTFGNLQPQSDKGYQYIEWTSASHIVVYQNNVAGWQNAQKIFAKGATAQEIAAWEAAGKTVVEVS